MKRNVLIVFLLSVFINGSFLWCDDETTLSLNQAVQMALKQHPELRASSLEVQAQEARMIQASARPNPEFSLLFEDVAGSGRFHGFDNSQTTAQLSQKLELGGKRVARKQIATITRDLAKLDLEEKRREILSTVRGRFIALIISQERARLMQELLDNSKEFSGAVIEKIQAGKIPPIDEVKANAVVASAEIDLNQSFRELQALRYELALVIGYVEPKFDSVQGQLLTNTPELVLQELIDLMMSGPALLKAEAGIEERQAHLTFEKSKRIPDLTFTGGYRALESSNDHAFLFGASAPLPLFDRNKGGILESERRLSKAENIRSSVQLQLKSSLVRAYHQYSIAKNEAEALEKRVLPANQTSFDATNEGYRLGKYGYLDVLEAQRSLAQSRLQYFRALTDFYTAGLELERITGKEILKLAEDFTGASK